MTEASGSAPASKGTFRGAGLWLCLSACLWMVHAVSVVAFGISVMARPAPIFAFGSLPVARVAVVTASLGAVALGFGLRSLVSGSSGLVASIPDATEGNPAHPRISWAAHRHGIVAARVCFVYAGIGLVAIAFFLPGPDLAFAIVAPNLWFLASVALVVVGLFGGDFLMKFVSLIGVPGDPFHLLRWYAALTGLSSNPFALILGFAGMDFIGICFLSFTFFFCPIIGIAAFQSIYRVGSRLIRMNPRGLAGTSNKTEHHDSH